MAVLQSKCFHYQEHWQVLYIKNLPDFLQIGQGLLQCPVSYNKISSSFKAAKLVVQIIIKLWYLTGDSAALLLGACQISGWLDNFKHKSFGFETSLELMIRCLISYWKRALDITSRHQSELSRHVAGLSILYSVQQGFNPVGSIIMFSNAMQPIDEKAPAFSQMVLVLEEL